MLEHVNGINGIGGLQPTRRTKEAYRLSEPSIPSDSVEISSDVMRLKGVEGVRMEKVMAIRSQIEAGTYFTPEKLNLALDAALDQIFKSR